MELHKSCLDLADIKGDNTGKEISGLPDLRAEKTVHPAGKAPQNRGS